MKKELLTGAVVAGVALTAAARPHWGHGGHHFWPGFAGAVVGHAMSDAIWAARGYRPAYGYYGYGYGYPVVAPTVVAAPVVYQQPQVIYQQPVQTVAYPQQQVVYWQPAPAAQPIQQPAPQPQEVRIVVEHQYNVTTQAVQSVTERQKQ